MEINKQGLTQDFLAFGWSWEISSHSRTPGLLGLCWGPPERGFWSGVPWSRMDFSLWSFLLTLHELSRSWRGGTCRPKSKHTFESTFLTLVSFASECTHPGCLGGSADCGQRCWEDKSESKRKQGTQHTDYSLPPRLCTDPQEPQKGSNHPEI